MSDDVEALRNEVRSLKKRVDLLMTYLIEHHQQDVALRENLKALEKFSQTPES